jgi:hypothetical protein
MQLVWSKSDPNQSEETDQSFQGNYQDVLRSVGAWLDARGFQLTRIVESGGAIMVEVETGLPGDDLSREVIRLDADSIKKLTSAARNDRNRFTPIGSTS